MAKRTLCSILVLSLSSLVDSACTGPSEKIGDYYYCQAVDRAVIHNVGHSGTYNSIVNMDSNTKKVETAPHSFAGPMAPFNEDLSLNFRGPLNLKRLAVFVPGATKQKRDTPDVKRRGTRYSTVVQEVDVYEKVVVETSACGGDATTHTEYSTVTRPRGKATGVKQPNVGAIISTAKGQFAELKSKTIIGTSTKGSKPAAASESTCAETCTSTVSVKGPRPATQSSSLPPKQDSKPQYQSAPIPSSSSNKDTSQTQSKGGWSRTGYYNRDIKSAEGLVFLNNRGGQASGVFDMAFGNSLSYADPVEDRAAASPQVWGGYLPQRFGFELSIWSDTRCTQELCGYSRPGAPAYYGFAGSSKLFLMEYNMPKATDPSKDDLPGIWMLNGHISRIGQYVDGNCWKSGCGELDIFEVLNGTTDGSRLIPTLHAKAGGGFSDFFARPTESFIKAAILMHNDSIVIQILPSTFDIDSPNVSQEQIEQLMSDGSWSSSKLSVLKLQS